MISPAYREAAFELARELSRREEVKSVVLFGSVARGEADARSDLDLLIVLENTGRKKEVNAVLSRIGKSYNLVIQSILTDGHFSGLDRNFVENVLKEGIILYGKQLRVKAKDLELEPHVIFRYDTRQSPQPIRAALARVLYGHRTEKKYKGKKYASVRKGIIEQYGGWKVGLATFLIPTRQAGIITKILKAHKVQYTKIEVWIAKV